MVARLRRVVTPAFVALVGNAVVALASCGGESTLAPTPAAAGLAGSATSGSLNVGGRLSSGGSVSRGGSPATHGGTSSGRAGNQSGGEGGAVRGGKGGGGAGGVETGGTTHSAGSGDAGEPSRPAGAGGDGGHELGVGHCDDEKALSGGLYSCRGGFRHRPTPQVCPLPARDETLMGLAGAPNDEESCQTWDDTECAQPDQCNQDADCGADSYCLFARYQEAGSFDFRVAHFCRRGCGTDDDCAANELCTCVTATKNSTRTTATLGVCRPGTCRVDADCGTGLLCTSPDFPRASWEYDVSDARFACQSSDDECVGPNLCPVLPVSDCCEAATCVNVDGTYRCDQRDTCDPC